MTHADPGPCSAVLETVPVLCPHCRTEVNTVTDGPGVLIEYVGQVGERGGDICSRCPSCGERVCYRVRSPLHTEAAA